MINANKSWREDIKQRQKREGKSEQQVKDSCNGKPPKQTKLAKWAKK
ncbi:MAG: hypothetical protein LBL90_08705 [Prevotellaceae bacterium]|nr:hypothetical protein [Prevotellaceae bacterium]